MRTRRILSAIVLFVMIHVFLVTVESDAYTVSFRIDFSPEDVRLRNVDGWKRLECEGTLPYGEPGYPQLLEKQYTWLIPWNMSVEDIRTVRTEWKPLGEGLKIAPAQPPQVLSAAKQRNEKVSTVGPNATVYSSDDVYPPALIDKWHTGTMRGHRLACCTIRPVRYYPRSGRVEVLEELEVEVDLHTALSKSSLLQPGGTGNDSDFMVERILGNTVLNPGKLDAFSPVKKEMPLYPASGYDYIIVTAESYVDEFQPLADWRMAQGLPAEIFTVESITSKYAGRDDQEKIRNFLIEAYSEWGTGWVLLGGDTNVVPARITWAMDCEAEMSPDENDIRCDLYYGDLDGDWDANENDVFGEVDDEVDLFPDLFVGRASVSTEAEASIWVNKLLVYEKNPPGDYETDMLFMGEILWWDPYTDGGLAKDKIDMECVPARFDPILKLYQSKANENYETVTAAINEGKNIINHNGHAWYNIMGIGDDYLSNNDMDRFENAPHYGIFYSIGCWPAAFDYDCIAEHWITAPDGGGVAFLGNNRYGWGSPGNPEYGYSDIFDREFFHQLLVEEINRLGAALALAKAVYIPYSLGENVYRWHQYQVNLLGDPAMPVWTDNPASMTVAASEVIPMGSSRYSVTVTDADGPVEEALVCLRQEGESYWRGWTDRCGQVDFHLHVKGAEGLKLTVTATDHLYVEKTIDVQADGPWCIAGIAQLDDSEGGNDDGFPEPDETVELTVPLINRGNEIAADVTAVMRIPDETYVTLLDSICHYGDIAPADSLEGESPYRFSLSPQCPRGYVILMELHSADENDSQWKDDIAIPVSIPHLSIADYSVDDGGNGIPEPGETVDLAIMLQNTGNGIAHGTAVTLTSLDGLIEVLSSESYCDDIYPDSIGTTSPPFSVAIAAETPLPYFPKLMVEAIAESKFAFTDTLVMPIGPVGFSDDAEEGEGPWVHEGKLDNWHISQNRFHSDSHSWYYGIENTWEYPNNADAALYAPQMAAAPGFYFSFWHWYQVAIYGVDGFYVEVKIDDDEWEVIDFIGSGGALDDPFLPLGGYWVEQRYDMPEIEAGSPVKVRFRFVSDRSDIAEGLYIDDFYFHGCQIEELTPIDHDEGKTTGGIPPAPQSSRIVSACPNPFNPTTFIRYDIAEIDGGSVPVEVAIFNVKGERVATLFDGRQDTGRYSLLWDGKDDAGRTLPSGVYVCLMKVSHARDTRKLMLLK
jgi:hypothetical protein